MKRIAFVGSVGAGKTTLFNALQGNDSNLLIVFYVQIMPDDFV
ncbi:EutP/PduV family microcompartment system protein, partial [Escherichia coli]